MKNKMLIEELTPEESNIIQESIRNGQDMWLSGVFMQADVKNRNNRVYPISEMTRAVESAQQAINNNQFIGELDHPQTLTINLDRVSHVITELRMEGNNAVGKAKLLATPSGNIAKALLEGGVKLGVSSRGAGQVNESGLVNDFSLVTIDIVATPSAPGAVPTSIYEAMEIAGNASETMSLAEAVRHDPKAQKFFKKEILKLLNTQLFKKV